MTRDAANRKRIWDEPHRIFELHNHAGHLASYWGGRIIGERGTQTVEVEYFCKVSALPFAGLEHLAGHLAKFDTTGQVYDTSGPMTRWRMLDTADWIWTRTAKTVRAPKATTRSRMPFRYAYDGGDEWRLEYAG